MLFIRFVAKSGDAMGMNMLSKATEFSLRRLLDIFPDMEVVSLSGKQFFHVNKIFLKRLSLFFKITT